MKNAGRVGHYNHIHEKSEEVEGEARGQDQGHEEAVEAEAKLVEAASNEVRRHEEAETAEGAEEEQREVRRLEEVERTEGAEEVEGEILRHEEAVEGETLLLHAASIEVRRHEDAETAEGAEEGREVQRHEEAVEVEALLVDHLSESNFTIFSQRKLKCHQV